MRLARALALTHNIASTHHTLDSLVAPSAVVQGRQRLGHEAVKHVFDLTQRSWHEAADHPTWSGLRVLGVDGVVWRTPETPENRARYDSASNQHGDIAYPQVRMVCQMELTRHLLTSLGNTRFLEWHFGRSRRQHSQISGRASCFSYALCVAA